MSFSNALKFSAAVFALNVFAAEANATGPAVSVSPSVNPPSTSTNASGSGFGDNEAVDIYFDTTDETLTVTNASGAFSAVATAVPASALPGTHWITAIGRHSGLAAQAKFTVRTNWAQTGYGYQNKSYNPFENVISPSNVAGLDLAWVANLGSALTGLTVYNGDLYVGTGSKLYALNATSGVQAWTSGTTITGSLQTGTQNAPIEAAGLVYITDTSGNVYALKDSTGAKVWSYATSDTDVGAGTVVANGKLYVPGTNNIYAFNAASARPSDSPKYPMSPDVATLWANENESQESRIENRHGYC